MVLMTIYGLVTLALIIAFVGLCIWSYSPKQKERFQKDANIPFMDDVKSNDLRGDCAHV